MVEESRGLEEVHITLNSSIDRRRQIVHILDSDINGRDMGSGPISP